MEVGVARYCLAAGLSQAPREWCQVPCLWRVRRTRLESLMLAASVCQWLCPMADMLARTARTAHPDTTISEYQASTQWAVMEVSLERQGRCLSHPQMIITVVIVIAITIITTIAGIVATTGTDRR